MFSTSKHLQNDFSSHEVNKLHQPVLLQDFIDGKETNSEINVNVLQLLQQVAAT